MLKINTNELSVVLDQYLQDIKIEDLQEELPDSTPRYLIISYELKHKDGRISYPLCGVYYNPSNSSLNNKMLYASSSTVVFQEAGITGKVIITHEIFDLTDPEDLTEEWLVNMLEASKTRP
jgi:hypothetical protein